MTAYRNLNKTFSSGKTRKNSLEPISQWVRSYVSGQKLVVLRSKKNDKPIEISFSEDGLKWVVDTKGKFIFFRDASPKLVRTVKGQFLKFVANSNGGLQPSEDYYIETFIPKDHYRNNGKLSVYLQGSEYLMCKKALSILSPYNERSFAQKDRIVWSTSENSN
jgi:hypothetical protein